MISTEKTQFLKRFSKIGRCSVGFPVQGEIQRGHKVGLRGRTTGLIFNFKTKVRLLVNEKIHQ